MIFRDIMIIIMKIDKKCLIAFIISVIISTLFIFFTKDIPYSYEKYDTCTGSMCATDTPTANEKTGWPLPIYSKEVGGMPSPTGYDNRDASIINAIIDFFAVFTVSFSISIFAFKKYRKA